MPALDVFNQDAFSVISLTARVNEMPFVPRQVGASGIFEEDGVSTTTVMIESRDGNLSLIEPTPRGGPGEAIDHDKRSVRSFAIPHFQRDDAVMADEVQGVRAFGTENEVETVEQKVDQKMARHARDLDATLEHQRVGAVKGLVQTKSGKQLFNLYTEFDIAVPDPISMGLNSDATKVREKCFDVINGIEDSLGADTYDGIHAFVGRDFWKALIEHKAVKETYLNTVQAAELRGDPNVGRFEFGGIVWERYRTGAKAKADLGAPYIADNEARVVPRGIPELFITRFGPADYEETVNTNGLPRYARQYPMHNGKGRHLEIQSNPITLCTRPQVLRKLTITT